MSVIIGVFEWNVSQNQRRQIDIGDEQQKPYESKSLKARDRKNLVRYFEKFKKKTSITTKNEMGIYQTFMKRRQNIAIQKVLFKKCSVFS